jgi:hypothetical protein
MSQAIWPEIYSHLYFVSWIYHGIHYSVYFVNNFVTIPS